MAAAPDEEGKIGLGNISADIETVTLKSTHDCSHSINEGETVVHDSLPDYYKAACESLTSGIKSGFLSDTDKAKLRVEELVHTQNVLRESVQQEMTNLDEYKLTEDISSFATELKMYHSKLLNLKKDIQYVNDKVAKMKRKAIKLQIGKEKEELHKAHQKQKELEFQKRLTAKPAFGSLDD